LESGRRLTQSGALVGTPEYMAPEQFKRGGAVTTAADVYGLGAILYELLTGRPPFKGSVYDVMLQAAERDPDPPTSVDRKANPDLGAAAMKCREKDPGRRYASAAALAEDLERWLRGEPVLARRVSPAERLWRLAKRKPAYAALVGTSAGAAVV